MICFLLLTERSFQTEALKKFQVENILSKIYVFRCHDYMQLIALSHVLPEFLTENSKVSENCTRLTPIQGGNLFVSKF